MLKIIFEISSPLTPRKGRILFSVFLEGSNIIAKKQESCCDGVVCGCWVSCLPNGVTIFRLLSFSWSGTMFAITWWWWWCLWNFQWVCSCVCGHFLVITRALELDSTHPETASSWLHAFVDIFWAQINPYLASSMYFYWRLGNDFRHTLKVLCAGELLLWGYDEPILLAIVLLLLRLVSPPSAPLYECGRFLCMSGRRFFGCAFLGQRTNSLYLWITVSLKEGNFGKEGLLFQEMYMSLVMRSSTLLNVYMAINIVE